MPIFIKEVLRFDVQSNGVFSAVPYVAVVFVINGAGVLSDKLISSKYLTKNNVRKTFSVLAFIIPALSLTGLSFVKCDQPYLGVGLLTTAIASSGISCGGYIVSYNDITGVYAGITFGISNTIAQLTGVIVPIFVASITKNQTQKEWAIVLITTASILFFGAIVTLIFGSTKAEPWAVKEKIVKRINDCDCNDDHVVNENYLY